MKYAILALIALASCKAQNIAPEARTIQADPKSCWSDKFHCTAMIGDDASFYNAHIDTGYNYIRCVDPETPQYEMNVYIPTIAEIDAQTLKVYEAIADYYQTSHDIFPHPHANGWSYGSTQNTYYGKTYYQDMPQSGPTLHQNFDPSAEVHVSTDWVASNIHSVFGPSTMIKLIQGQDPEEVLSCN